jgi:hypothetical protein
MKRYIQSTKRLVTTGVLATLGMAVGYAATAQANLVSADFKTPGDGLLTRDTRTGLEWLDLSQTANLTYASVLSGANGFTKKERFRLATKLQVDGLFQSARQEPSTFPANAMVNGDAVGADRLHTLMGYRACGGGAVASGINSKICSGQAYFGKADTAGLVKNIGYYYYQVSGTPRQTSPMPPTSFFSVSGDLSFRTPMKPLTTPDFPSLLVRSYRR